MSPGDFPHEIKGSIFERIEEFTRSVDKFPLVDDHDSMLVAKLFAESLDVAFKSRNQNVSDEETSTFLSGLLAGCQFSIDHPEYVYKWMEMVERTLEKDKEEIIMLIIIHKLFKATGEIAVRQFPIEETVERTERTFERTEQWGQD